MLLSVFSLNQQRNSMQLQNAAHARDAERLVYDFASEVMARVESPQTLFDQSFAGIENAHVIRDGSILLTFPEHFGLAPGLDPHDPLAYTTVDSYVDFPEEHTIQRGNGEIPVRVTVDVRYVAVNGATGEVTPSATPTFSKEVTIRVVEVQAAQRAPAEATLTRLITPSHLAFH